MTLEEAVKTMVNLPTFKKDLKGNKQLQIYAKRWMKGEGRCTIREYLLKYGFTENYEEPKS